MENIERFAPIADYYWSRRVSQDNEHGMSADEALSQVIAACKLFASLPERYPDAFKYDFRSSIGIATKADVPPQLYEVWYKLRGYFACDGTITRDLPGGTMNIRIGKDTESRRLFFVIFVRNRGERYNVIYAVVDNKNGVMRTDKSMSELHSVRDGLQVNTNTGLSVSRDIWMCDDYLPSFVDDDFGVNEEHTCSVCGRYNPFFSSTYNIDSDTNEVMCSDCIHNNDMVTFYCDVHERYEMTSDINAYTRIETASGRLTSCHAGLATLEWHDCPSCGNQVIGSGDALCRLCNRAVEEHHSVNKYGLASYGTKPKPLFISVDGESYREDNTPYFGFELEEDGGENRDACAREIFESTSHQVYCKSDCSLQHGVEAVSHPMTIDYLMSRFDFDGLLGIFHEHGNEASTRCGFHVHVNRKSLGGSDEERDVTCAKVVHIMTQFRELFTSLSNRTDEGLTRWATFTPIDLEAEDSNAQARRKLRNEEYFCERYRMLNMTNRNTIEFRLWAASDDVDTLKSYLDITYSIVEVAKSISIAEVCELTVDKLFELIASVCKNGETTMGYMRARNHV